MVAVPESWTVVDAREYNYFPDKDRLNKHRGWRKFLGVWARDTDGGLWLFACVHIISGTSKVKVKDENGDDMVIEDHSLPGKRPEQKEDFKAHCLCGASSVCMRLYSSAESRRGGGIIIARDGHRLGLGSSNVVGHVDKKGEPVRGFWGVTSKETPSGWALSNKEVDRDWVFSDLPIEAGVTRAPRLAWEKGHLSVTAVVEKRAVPAESQDILAQVRHVLCQIHVARARIPPAQTDGRARRDCGGGEGHRRPRTVANAARRPIPNATTRARRCRRHRV